MVIKGSWSGDGILWEDDTVCSKKYHPKYLFDNLCYNETSGNRIQVLLVVRGLERYAETLNQSTSLVFCKTEASYLSQKRTC